MGGVSRRAEKLIPFDLFKGGGSEEGGAGEATAFGFGVNGFKLTGIEGHVGLDGATAVKNKRDHDDAFAFGWAIGDGFVVHDGVDATRCWHWVIVGEPVPGPFARS